MFDLDLAKILVELTRSPLIKNACGQFETVSPLLFSSGLFLFLFLGFYSVYQALMRHNRLRIAWVMLFSLFFYFKCAGGFWLLHVLIVVVDFNLARWMYRSKSQSDKTMLLIVSLVVNLGMLVYFKYNLYSELFCEIFEKPFNPCYLFLPAGISFFTFQSLSYTIDVYRGQLKAEDSMLDYAFYVTFFPQMVAGPIVRAADFLPQIRRPVFVSREDFGRGFFLICTGLFKKAVISDYISVNFVDRVFESPLQYTGLENLFGVYGYALQIYCDFSGYSDMAIGLALLMGFKFPINFDAPYQSLSITEFWRRWHISLSTWLRDYLYIPLGGNRGSSIGTWIVTGGFLALTLGLSIFWAFNGAWWWLALWSAVVTIVAVPALWRGDRQALSTNFNLFATMLLGGLWHGAASRFIIWGALHGLALAAEKWIKIYAPGPSGTFRRVLGGILTFHFVCFCWIFFRAEGMEKVGQMLHQIAYEFRPEFFVDFLTGYGAVLFWMMLGFGLHFLPKSTELAAQRFATALPLFGKALLLTAFIALVMQVKSAEVQSFIYFHF
ncbi:MAG: MBOAT family protein [Phycisphaerae bacterium]|nr:MBOAT family protein [Saprospiraceae bacterium]